MEALFSNVLNITWQQVVMWVIGGVLIYLAIKKDMEPALLLPIGFGAILVNLPLSGAVTQVIDNVTEVGILDVLFGAGIANELFPLLLFIGIGAMIDFGPLLSNPKMLLFLSLIHIYKKRGGVPCGAALAKLEPLKRKMNMRGGFAYDGSRTTTLSPFGGSADNLSEGCRHKPQYLRWGVYYVSQLRGRSHAV